MTWVPVTTADDMGAARHVRFVAVTVLVATVLVVTILVVTILVVTVLVVTILTRCTGVCGCTYTVTIHTLTTLSGPICLTSK